MKSKLFDRRLWIGVLGLLIVAFLIMQFIPMKKENPPVKAEPNWDSPETRALAEVACFDCHSNETNWRWYADVAPTRLLVRNDVKEGREHLNFSDWDRDFELDELVEVIKNGEMPPFYYGAVHPDAKLSDEEKDTLIQGLQLTLAASISEVSDDSDDDD